VKLFSKATKKKITAYAREEVPQRPKDYPFKSHALLAVSFMITYYVSRTPEFGIMIPVQYIYGQVFAGAMTLATHSAIKSWVWNANLQLRKMLFGDARKGRRKMNPWVSLALIVVISYFWYMFNCHIYAAEVNRQLFVAAFLGFILVWVTVNGLGAILKVEKDYEAFSPSGEEGYITTWKAILLTLVTSAAHIAFIVLAKEVLLNVHL
jgi:hypothetical protein